MGGTNSQYMEPATPPTHQARSRVLEIDPRSPSAEINRTPIVVDKTPASVLDPRSPTVGIVRTPLPPVGLTQLDLNKDIEAVAFPSEEMQIDEPDVTPKISQQKEEEEEEQFEEFDPLGVTNIHCLSLDNFPTCESTRLVPNEEPLDFIVETEKLRAKKKKQKAAQPKELFPHRKSEFSSVTRSPLSSRNAELNSPLKMVQRKQTNKVNKARTCAMESSTSKFIARDKENM